MAIYVLLREGESAETSTPFLLTDDLAVIRAIGRVLGRKLGADDRTLVKLRLRPPGEEKQIE